MTLGKNVTFLPKIVRKSNEYLEIIKQLENWDFGPK